MLLVIPSYCIVLYLFSVQNIHDKDTELVNIQHTHNNKYIQFKVPEEFLALRECVILFISVSEVGIISIPGNFFGNAPLKNEIASSLTS
jgi:hypothetical protein